MVYNTATVEDVTPGFYINNGIYWSKVTSYAVLPLLTTTTASAISYTTATSGGVITIDGGAAVTANGVCWSTTAGPTIANSKTIDTVPSGAFSSSLTELSPNTRYYVRAYATNSAGTGYGAEVSFTATVPVVTSISTTAATFIGRTSATFGSTATFAPGESLYSIGVLCGTPPGLTVSSYSGVLVQGVNNTNVTTAVGTYSPFRANTIYYYRAWIYGSNNIAYYGDELSFTTRP